MPLSRSIRQVFRPVYGEKCEVRPKRWWHPRERKAARLAAKVADYHADEFMAKVARKPPYPVPLILKEPVPPLHSWLLAGRPGPYPGDEAFPEAAAAYRKWREAMEAQGG